MKTILGHILLASGYDRFLRLRMNRRHRNVLRILSAHRVIDEAGELSDADQADLARGCLSLKTFKRAMSYLCRHYQFVPLREAAAIIDTASQLPANVLVLTFDDAYRDVYSNALPIIKERKIPFTVFLTADYIDRREEMLTSALIRQMAEDPELLVTWGAHGLSHTPLTDLPHGKRVREVRESRRKVAELTGGKVRFFCYPDGMYDDDVKRIIIKEKFHAACATGRKMNVSPIDRLALQRIPFEEEPLWRFAMRFAGRTG